MEEERERYGRMMMMSPEIVEIGEEDSRRSFAREAAITTGNTTSSGDVYVAVGKDDVDVLKWVLDNLVVAGGRRIFLVHVFPPVTYIPTPVGKLSRSQLSQDQVRVYINEENNRRRSLLHKYIRLCTDAKVPVDTMLIESDTTAKAIVDLIPVLNITNLVIGTNKSPYYPRLLLMKKLGKGEYVRKNAPDYCEVSIAYNGQKVVMDVEAPAVEPNTNPNHWFSQTNASTKPEISSSQHKEWNLFKCACFSVSQTMKDDHREQDSTNSGEVVIRTNHNYC